MNGQSVKAFGRDSMAIPRQIPTHQGDFLYKTNNTARVVNVSVNSWATNHICPFMASHQWLVPNMATETSSRFPTRDVGIRFKAALLVNTWKSNTALMDPMMIENWTMLILSTPTIATKGMIIKAGSGGLGTYHRPLKIVRS